MYRVESVQTIRRENIMEYLHVMDVPDFSRGQSGGTDNIYVNQEHRISAR